VLHFLRKCSITQSQSLFHLPSAPLNTARSPHIICLFNHNNSRRFSAQIAVYNPNHRLDGIRLQSNRWSQMQKSPYSCIQSTIIHGTWLVHTCNRSIQSQWLIRWHSFRLQSIWSSQMQKSNRMCFLDVLIFGTWVVTPWECGIRLQSIRWSQMQKSNRMFFLDVFISGTWLVHMCTITPSPFISSAKSDAKEPLFV